MIDTKRLVCLAALLFLPLQSQAFPGDPGAAAADGRQSAVSSPDGRLTFRLWIEDLPSHPGALFYSLSFEKRRIVHPSRLGITTIDLPGWTEGFSVSGETRRSADEIWHPVYGERKTVTDRYNEWTVELRQSSDTARALRIIVRAYNEGIAFCYDFPERLSTSIINIKDELTEFSFPAGTKAYVTPFAQELYHLRPLRNWRYGSSLPLPAWAPPTPEVQSERPLTLLLPGGLLAAVGEARLVDYARMKLALSSERPNTIVARLAGPVTESSPFTTPWRVIMVAETPAQLLARNDIFLNLNPPSAIPQTGWIRPGKVMREVTLSTEGAIACIDFCAAHNIQYVEFDAGWYGYEYSKSSDAARVDVDPRRNPRKDLDLQKAIAYARSKGVGVILYVNHRALERQIDELFPLYQKWGVAGLKFGFVHVGSDRWTAWVHEAVRKAARYNLMVDIHDEYRPTGVSRTYPNLMTQEGIYGNECMPDADHNTTVPFTRFLAGAADYTICYYHQKGIKDVPGIKTTSAHQLALSVVFYSPLQFVFWYDRPSDYRGEPEVEFFEHVPTVWDTTCVLQGEIGKSIAVARKSGGSWFIGAITNTEGRSIELPLSFLDPGTEYEASIYTDGGASIPTRTHVKIERRKVSSGSVIRTTLKPSGGVAMEIRPAAGAAPSPPRSAAVLTAPADTIDWRAVASWGVEGRGWGDVKRDYDRFPGRAEGHVRDKVWDLSRHSAGMSCRFITDATEIQVRYTLFNSRLEMAHMPATGVSGVDLYVLHDDGSWRWIGTTQPTSRRVSASVVRGMPGGRRTYMAYLPLYNGLDSLEIGVTGGAAFEPVAPRTERPILFYGTSIMHGACASRPGMAIPAILGRRLDLPVINLGFSGNGRMEPEVGRLIAEIDARIYVVDCLPNLTAQETAERTEPLVRLLRAGRPSTPILLVEDRTFQNAVVRPDRLKEHDARRRALRGAYDRLVASGIKHLYYLEGSDLLGSDGDGTVDGSHPTDLGMMRYADAYERALRPILKEEQE